MSLRFRLNLMIVSAVVVILGLGGWFATHNARKSVEAEMQASVHLALQLTEAALLSTRGEALATLLDQMARLDKTRHLRFQIGTAAETPPLPPAPAADLETRDVPAWFAWAVAPQPLMVERRFQGPGGQAAHIAIQAYPADELAEAWGKRAAFWVSSPRWR